MKTATTYRVSYTGPRGEKREEFFYSLFEADEYAIEISENLFPYAKEAYVTRLENGIPQQYVEE